MKKRGKGIAIGFYPTGMPSAAEFNPFCDFSQAVVRVQVDGSAQLTVGSVDIGQGVKTVLAQMVAEELGINYEQVTVINSDTDTCPICVGTFATRVTYFAGNATVEAAREARQILFEAVAGVLEVSPDELEAKNGKISVKNNPQCAMAIGDAAGMTLFVQGKHIIGRGSFKRYHVLIDPDTGKTDPFAALAWCALQAEVEVDTETGEVEVLKFISSYDAGKAINPLLVEGQIQGGEIMGLGSTLMEQIYPYFPKMEHQPVTMGDYVIPTAADIPEMQTVIYECPSPNGPYGAKGIGEMTGNLPSPAIAHAIYDAIGVWIDEQPVTPEKVLRALQKKRTCKTG